MFKSYIYNNSISIYFKITRKIKQSLYEARQNIIGIYFLFCHSAVDIIRVDKKKNDSQCGYAALLYIGYLF